MEKERKINWYRVVNIIVIILFIILLRFCTGNPVTTIKIKPEKEPTCVSSPKPEIITITEKVDTAEFISYCIKHGLIKLSAPKNNKVVHDTIFISCAEQNKPAGVDTLKNAIKETEESIPEQEENERTYLPSPEQPLQIADPIFKCKKISPYVTLGANTLPSVSLGTGIFINHSWGIGIEGNYYFYNGLIDNSIVADDVTFIIRARKVNRGEEQIGVMEFPKFSVGLKVTKIF